MPSRRDRLTIRKRRGTQVKSSSLSTTTNHGGSDTHKRIVNYKTRLAKSGRDVPKYEKNKGKSNLGKVVDNVLTALDKPRNATMVGLNYLANDKDFFKGASRGWKGKERVTGYDVLDNLGVDNSFAKKAGGLAIDIATDPLTYVTGGTGKFLKGVATGKKAVKTMDVADSVVNIAKQRATKQAEQEILKGAGRTSKAGVAKKFGTTLDDVDEAITKRAFSNTTGLDRTLGNESLERAFRDTVLKADEAGRAAKAGKGMSVMGKTIVSGDKMQDAGAAIGKLLPLTPVRNAVGNMFNANRVAGATDAAADIYRRINQYGKGSQNLADATTYETAKDLATLTKNYKIGDAKLDDVINDFISTNKQGLSDVDRGTVLARSAAQREAAQRLGLPAEATVDDVVEKYKSLYKDMGKEEMQAGILKNMRANYAPRIKSDTAMKRRGGIQNDASISNPFSYARDEAYEGRPIAEINAEIRQRTGEDFDLFETSALKTFATRALSHNKLLADREVVDELLTAMGKQVPDKATMRRLQSEGYDIVVPKQRIRLYSAKGANDLIKDRVEEGFESGLQHTLSNLTDDQLSVISDKAALQLLGTRDGTKVMLALPKGIAQQFNSAARQQVNASVKAFLDTVDMFNRMWKPLVTSMNINFHRRNLVSASFNNFLDVGMDMFNPNTQRMALSVVKGLPDGVTTIGGRRYTSAEIRDLMAKHGALSSFGMNEANNLTKGVMGDVSTLISGVSPFRAVEKLGRGAGNRVEEYVRATNFISHLKQGLTPENAAEMVSKFQFDYTDLTKFERMLKTVFPFYTWLRKNLPLQLEQMLDNPSAYLAVKRLQESSAKDAGIDYEDLPMYLQETGGLPYGEPTKDGRIQVADLGLPISDLYTSGRDIANMVTPIIKAPLELMQNKSWFTGQELYNTNDSAAAKLTQTGTGAIDKLIQSNAGLSKLIREHPEAAKVIDTAINNSGLFSNVNKYGASTDTSNKAVQNRYQRYPDLGKPAMQKLGFDKKAVNKYNDTASAIINILRGLSDPSPTKYWDEDIAKKNQDYEYLSQLAEYVAAQKEKGEPVPTLRELQKKGLL